MTVVRSRRAGISAEEAAQRPMYARTLGLQYLRPSSLVSFVFFEGSIALAVLLALAELAQWWIVAVLPLSIAAMVKLNDIIAGAAVASGGPARVRRARGRAVVPHPPTVRRAPAAARPLRPA
ncbi:hypothetical protein, partial [Allorhizocola rhizosphaerae]|uniref:hypothetical protein n=1 Tax=Allorhizocola rhizosphaerae TaxID=1872709 RepID=UPI000E3C8059